MVKAIFSRSYDVSRISALADATKGLPCFEYEDIQSIDRELATSDLNAFALMLTPAGGLPWIGLFWGDMGATMHDGWFTCPATDAILIRTRFECFYGKVEDPYSFKVLPTRPVQDVLVFEDQGLILITADQEMLAINSSGPVWHTVGITSDSVFVTDVSQQIIRGHGNPNIRTGELQEFFKINAATGEIFEGGDMLNLA